MPSSGKYVVSDYEDQDQPSSTHSISVKDANFSTGAGNNASRGSYDGNATSALGFDDDGKKQRVTDIALMVWGVLDVIAIALMVWAVLIAALVGVTTMDGETIEVGLFEQCRTTEAGSMTCEKTDAFSRIPNWFWASGVFMCSLVFTLIEIAMIGLATYQGRSFVRRARFCAAARNSLLFVAWVLIPIGFIGLGETCDASSKIHCNLQNTAPVGSGFFDIYELPENWHIASGTYGLFVAVLIHYLGSGIAGWIIVRKGNGLEPVAAKDASINRGMGVTEGSRRTPNPNFNDSFMSVGNGTSFDDGSRMRSTVNDTFNQTRSNDEKMMTDYPTTSLSGTTWM